MFGADNGHNLDRDDTYGYEEEKLAWFERFDVRPVNPETVHDQVEAGAVLQTVDLPLYLNRGLAVEPSTGMALYRLTQLFGSPNVDIWTAGSEMPDRGATTWQYLFDVVFDGEGGEERQFLLSVYDFKTDVSVGISKWDGDGGDHPVPEPTASPPEGIDLPDEEFCEGVVQLVLNMLEEPVPATHNQLWI